MSTKSKGIAFRLSLYVLISVSILFLLFGAVNYQISRKILVDKVSFTSDAITNEALTKIRNQIQSIQTVTEDIHNTLIEATGADEATIKVILRNYIQNLDGISGISSIFKDSTRGSSKLWLSYYLKESDTLVRRKPYDSLSLGWYTNPFVSGQSSWTEPHYGILHEHQKVITYSIPLIEEGVVGGLVNTHVSLDWLDKILSDLKVFDSGIAFLISRDGTFLTHPNRKEYIGTRSVYDPVVNLPEEKLQELISEISSRNSGYLELKDQLFTGENVFLIYRPLDMGLGTLLLLVPKDEVLSGLYQLSFILIIIVIISFTLLIILVFMVTKKMLAPLNLLSQTLMKIGEGDFEVEIPDYNRDDEIGNLRQSFIQMTDDLKKHVILLDKSTAERDQILSEINLAARIQKSIIPASTPEDLLEKGYDVYGILKPAKQVGGDFYDYFLKDGSKLYFVIGDVTGKGIPASFFMGMTRTFFRTESKYTSNASELLTKINEDLCLNNPEGIFVTAFCGIVDLKSGQVDYCNAGHNFPILVKQNKQEILSEQHGTPLGLVEGQIYKSDSFTMDPDATLFLYTDGVTEARNAADGMLGINRLETILEALFIKTNQPEDLAHLLVDKVVEFEADTDQDDDLTVLFLKREGKKK